MAVRQYVGARYVPKFYENSLGTAEWQTGVAYEPLTIVTYNGNSFTSKKEVPTSIGAPNENPAYWASTGIYNAQIDEYREETAQAMQAATKAVELAEDLRTKKILANCRFVFVGDSYAAGYTGTDGDVPENGWPNQIKNMLGLSNTQFYSVYGGGAGFSADRPGGGYGAMLQTIIDTVQDPDTIDYVICAGGHNDRVSGAAAIKTGMAAFYNIAHNAFPNARVMYGMIGWDKRVTFQNTINTAFKTYLQGQKENAPKLEYLNGVEYSLANVGAYLDADNIHPNAAGNKQIAKNIINAIATGSATTYESASGLEITAASGWRLQGSSGAVCSIDNNNLTLGTLKMTFQVDGTNPVVIGGNGGSVDICTISNLPRSGDPSGLSVWRDKTYLVRHQPTGQGAKYEYIPGYLGIVDNKLRVGLYHLNSAGSNWENINALEIAVDQMIIPMTMRS